MIRCYFFPLHYKLEKQFSKNASNDFADQAQCTIFPPAYFSDIEGFREKKSGSKKLPLLEAQEGLNLMF